MKVLIFDSTVLEQAPYIKYYERELVAKNIAYNICTWDKYSDAKITTDGCVITIHQKWHLGKRKYFDFISVSRKLKEIIDNGHYTHLILVNTIWAMLLRHTLLSHFRNRYILDVRDYKCETITGYQFFLKDIINNSFFTTISSDGFREFLPKSAKIITNHNITNIKSAFKLPSLCANKKHVSIGFFGYIRYKKENELLIHKMGGNRRFSLFYRGVYAENCRLDKMSEIKYSNVNFGGPFNNDDKPVLYKNVDMIHSIYGNEDLATSTLLPNRLYDAIIFKKPLLVSPHTYLAHVVEKYNLGVSIDLNNPNFMLELNKYIASFDELKFINGAIAFTEIVNMQQMIFFNNSTFPPKKSAVQPIIKGKLLI